VIIGNFHVVSRQACNCSARNGGIDDTGTIAVINHTTWTYFPNSRSVTGCFTAGSKYRAVKENQPGNFKYSDHQKEEDRQGHSQFNHSLAFFPAFRIPGEKEFHLHDPFYYLI
jgi:hypothetical protein